MKLNVNKLSRAVTAFVVAALWFPVVSAAVTTHEIRVLADGTFSPQTTTISPNDSVRFIMHDVRDSVIPALGVEPNPYPAICAAPKGWVDPDPNNFAGPMPVNVSGIFTLNPNPGEPGLVQMIGANNPCGQAEVRGHVGNTWLCASGMPNATMDATWADPSLVGVFIRLNWGDVNPAEGHYKLDGLIAEVEKAVANGKLYSIGIEAGRAGTPDWIFDTDVVPIFSGFPPQGQYVEFPRAKGGGGVRRLKFQDFGSGQFTGDCGAEMYLGSPTDSMYEQHYATMLATIAATLKSNAAWYRALAYVKLSGANLFTAENRLPKRCEAGCICNTRVWSEAGYTPTGLRAFYEHQNAYMHYYFPGKTRSYALIQDGFPRVDDGGGYVDENGGYIDGNGAAVPNSQIGPYKQTQDIIDESQAWGTSFAVQHNGLQPRPADCSNPDNAGCPNKWVVEEGAQGQPIGFQTQNIHDIDDNVLLESALDNAYANSTATFVEIYEERSWEARIEGVLQPGSVPTHTLAWWGDRFHARRLGIPQALLPFVQISFTHTPQRSPFGPAGDQTLYFIHGSKCGTDPGTWGKIVIRP